MDIRLELNISRQPDETTCGPTCLHAIYRYFGDGTGLDDVVAEVEALEEGGTLGVLLASHALRRGYRAKIYSYNLQTFDPTWFFLPSEAIRERLEKQRQAKTNPKVQLATAAYLEFLDLGGELSFEDLSEPLLHRYLDREIPLLTGLSATYLYRTPREHGDKDDFDDIRGEPSGHFVVLCGYDRVSREFLLADPLDPNPLGRGQSYHVGGDRLINAILLGVLTYDANVVVIEPKTDSP